MKILRDLIKENRMYLGDYIIVNTTTNEIVDTAGGKASAKMHLERLQSGAVNPHRFKVFKRQDL